MRVSEYFGVYVEFGKRKRKRKRKRKANGQILRPPEGQRKRASLENKDFTAHRWPMMHFVMSARVRQKSITGLKR